MAPVAEANRCASMHDELFSIMAARRGHFRLESGHHGELWLDVDRLFVQPDRVRPMAAKLAERLAAHNIECVCGPLTGGAFLAQMITEEMGVPWVYAARVAAPAAEGLFPIAYPIPSALAEFVRGQRTAVINDVTNAGSAVRGAIASLQDHGAKLAAIASLLVLGSAAAELASQVGVPLESLAQAANAIWPPATCPMCAAQAPLESIDA
jgi:orotate phosphoribosyltransferase